MTNWQKTARIKMGIAYTLAVVAAGCFIAAIWTSAGQWALTGVVLLASAFLAWMSTDA